MIRVYTAPLPTQDEPPLDAMFRLRHKVLVETLGWTGLQSTNGREIDQFDTPETIYVVSFDPDGQTVRGSVRFTPSIFPTLSSEVFPDVFHGGPPTGPDIYDVSRIVVDPAAQKLGMPNPVAAELFTAWIEAGFAVGLECFTAVVSLPQIAKRVARGWRMIPIGLPREADGEDVVGIRVPIDREALALAQRTEGVSRYVITPEDRYFLLQNHDRLKAMTTGTTVKRNNVHPLERYHVSATA